MKSKFNKTSVNRILKKLKINIDDEKYSIVDIIKGAKVELEHGSENKLTNITRDNSLKTVKIALAHLMEFPDYYERLEKMEKKAKLYWSKRK